MTTHNFLFVSLPAMLAAAVVGAPARAQAPIVADQTKTVLTIQRVLDGNGSKVVAATIQVQVEFDRKFFCRADVDGRTLSARGIVRRGTNQFFRAELEFSDRKEGSDSAVKVNFLARAGEHRTLAAMNGSRASERIEAFIAGQDDSR